jgi:hypothetical protein
MPAAAPAAAASSGATAPAPGKRTQIEEMTAHQTHQQFAQYCDPGANGQMPSGCFLDPVDAQRLHDAINARIGLAVTNWSSALVRRELALLLKHETAWDTFWELGFTIGIMFLSAGLGSAVEFLAATTYAVSNDVPSIVAMAELAKQTGPIKKAFSSAAKALKIPAKGAVDSMATGNSDEHVEAQFLETLKNQPAMWGDHLRQGYSKDMDHWGWLLLYGLLDPSIMSVTNFEDQIALLIGRFQSQVLAGGRYADHGDTMEEQEGWVWVQPRNGGAKRLARVTRKTAIGAMQAYAAPVRRFRQWVSPDMEPMALAAWHEKFPDQAEDSATLDDLDGVPAEAYKWEASAAHGGTP